MSLFSYEYRYAVWDSIPTGAPQFFFVYRFFHLFFFVSRRRV